MRFHEFGNKNAPCIILIHGVLTPWQMWEYQIDHFKNKYFVIAPALNAHIEEEPSEYISAEKEAEQIMEYVINNYGKDIFLLAGLSMGGVVANKIFESGILHIEHLVLDGAPLVPAPKIMEYIMKKNYTSIIHGAQKRRQKILKDFVNHFMPKRFLPSFLRIADNMSDESVANMVNSACRCKIHKVSNTDTKILFLHGTKPNETFAKSASKKLQKAYPNVTVKAFKGYAHGELAIYHPDEWCQALTNQI